MVEPLDEHQSRRPQNVKIPLSAIEPFGVVGIPAIGYYSGRAIGDALETFFDSIIRTTRITKSPVDDNVRIFCSVSRGLVRKLGAIYCNVDINGQILDAQGEIVAASVRIYWVMPNKHVFTRHFQFR